ncbi:MAG: XTP/dITP diphosphatase [Fusobacteriaceae bacterium]|jgi:XTP/dITP diphosphohydrolase|nr:XTP/dITP diphosphatase [Fusobacteriaceae bacterium]
MKLFLATGNVHKVEEMIRILDSPPGVDILSVRDGIRIPEIIEDGNSFEENAIKKALGIAKYLNMTVIADDSGLEVAALKGEPGIHSARYAGVHGNDRDNNKKLIGNLKGAADRSAKFVCVICVGKPDGQYVTFRGEVSGEITDVPRGENGFGYDPHFFLKSMGKTMAEMSPEEKNAVSHRGKALSLLKSNLQKFLENN